MTLTTAVTNILCKRVTEQEAKQFALDNYGVLAAYIRHQFVAGIIKKDSKQQGKLKILPYDNTNSRKN